ncbi:hypothetical protein DFH08DRAFT_978614 [Mycena albidolilacea]|uniref:CxC2-like cysteine cluster KDZ transposase-associated domain-containing protein n=1 Tax=Mycena albidolilacea TaxID=1033008 RepID=A0AAD6YYM3_9AGAR|nr:hypothetical protein DFH08DRAFT_978614 [Mycena albidolilacea]
MAKRKALYVEEDDLNDGSNTETITMGSRGVRSTMLPIPTPTPPAKNSKSTLKPDVPAAPAFSFDDWEAEYTEFDAEFGAGMQTTGPRKLRESVRRPSWAMGAEDFLNEVLRHDGRGDYIDQGVCAGPGCEATEISYRCSDCMHRCLYCGSCMKCLHASMLFLRIERWENGWFWQCILKSLGVQIQLGHRVGKVCPNPSTAAGDDFVVITTTSKAKSVQLLHMRLYPATGTNPRSAATFVSLRRFAHMTLESKCSPYEFYHSLVRETDSTGLEPSQRVLQDDAAVAASAVAETRWPRPLRVRGIATKPGEVALLCPACPHPGINLPPDWHTVPAHHRFLYALFLAIDTNFCLMRKDVSSEEKDPGLVWGWGFFGDVTKYMAHLEKHWDQKEERSTCVSHDAVDKPLQEFLGTASSEIGTVDCACHNMKHPNGVGNLQMGERYLNMDYSFFMSLAGCILLQLFVSYITCQWYKNIWERMRIFDPHVQLKGGKTSVGFLVPKFRLPAHIESCNILFSFNLTPFVGRTDGEVPEHGWADANCLVNSTSVSGPGVRRDTLKTLGTTLRDRLQKNLPLMVEPWEAWVNVEASFSVSVIEMWMAMVHAWEVDAEKPNLFASTVHYDDLTQVWLQMAKIAADDVDHLRVRGDMHETEMLSMGLQLEESQ